MSLLSIAKTKGVVKSNLAVTVTNRPKFRDCDKEGAAIVEVPLHTCKIRNHIIASGFITLLFHSGIRQTIILSNLRTENRKSRIP